MNNLLVLSFDGKGGLTMSVYKKQKKKEKMESNGNLMVLCWSRWQDTLF